MPKEPKTFTVADPATFDGDPFEVAQRAMEQARAVAGIFRFALEGALPMLRSAEMERQIYATGEADAEAFDTHAQARMIGAMVQDCAEVERMCGLLAKAAGFNPRHPPKE
jgi:hypothetical protein